MSNASEVLIRAPLTTLGGGHTGQTPTVFPKISSFTAIHGHSRLLVRHFQVFWGVGKEDCDYGCHNLGTVPAKILLVIL